MVLSDAAHIASLRAVNVWIEGWGDSNGIRAFLLLGLGICFFLPSMAVAQDDPPSRVAG